MRSAAFLISAASALTGLAMDDAEEATVDDEALEAARPTLETSTGASAKKGRPMLELERPWMIT